MRNDLAIDRMSLGQLWDRAFTLIHWCMPLQYGSLQELELLLNQLEAVLQELKLRGEQYALFPEDSHGVGSS